MKLAASERPCSGCAHSASGIPYPGHPSGERPCCFCVRNPELARTSDVCRDSDGNGVWYDGKTPAYKTPMDNYIATDRLQQERLFAVLGAIERGELTVKPRQTLAEFYGVDCDVGMGDPKTMCCEGGPFPGGHSGGCILLVGVSIS